MNKAAVRDNPAAPKPLSNRGFLIALLLASLALTFSATLLIVGYLLFSPDAQRQEAAATRDNIRPWRVEGQDLIPRMGKGEATLERALHITELAAGVDNRAIFTRRARLKAEDYAFLESQVSGLHPGLFLYFIWRTERAPNEVFYQPVYWTGDDPKLQMLAKHPEWRGTVVEVGIDVYGTLRDAPTNIETLTLVPHSAVNLLRSIWAEWTAVEGWMQSSAHHLRGTPPNPIMHVTPVIAAWAALSLILLGGLWLVKGPVNFITLTLVVAIPWISLDLLWQKRLSTQLEDTRYFFAGKTMHEKRLVDWESELYQYGRYLKMEVLPEPGVRIFLLERGPIRGFRRLKMQYFLLPHNVFNYGHYPRPESVQPGDYFMVLGEIDGLRYDEASSALIWQEQSITVERLDQHPLGSVYRYGGRP